MSQHEQQRSGSVQAEADRLKRDADVTAQRAQGEARNIAAEAKGAARDVADEAREIGSSVKSEALGVVSAVRQGLADKAEEQKDGVADRIGAIADRAHSTADELRDREAWLAGLIDRGARELDGFADAVRHRDINTIWSSLESFGRRQPALFMGAAVAAGFALTRLARASMERQYHQAYSSGVSHGRGDYGTRAGYTAGSTSYPPGRGGSPTSGTGADYGMAGAGRGVGAGTAGRTAGGSPTSGTGADYGAAAGSGRSTTAGTSPASGGGSSTSGTPNQPNVQRTSTEFERHVQGAAAATGGGTAAPGAGTSGSAY
jgi:hypothetical protein